MRPGRLCPTSLQGNASKPDRKMGPNQHALGFPYFLPPSPLLHTPLILLDNSKGFCTAPPAHTDLPLGCRESSRGKERGAHAQPSSTALIPLSFLSLTEQMDPPTPRQCAALSLQHSVFALWVTLCPLCWAGPCYQISFSFQVYLNRDFRAGKAVRCMLTRRRAGGGGGGGEAISRFVLLGGMLGFICSWQRGSAGRAPFCSCITLQPQGHIRGVEVGKSVPWGNHSTSAIHIGAL